MYITKVWGEELLDHTHFCRYLIYFVLRQLRIMVSYISGIDSELYSLLGGGGGEGEGESFPPCTPQ